MKRKLFLLVFLTLLALSVGKPQTLACPFCAAISNTLSQDLADTEVVAIGTFKKQLSGSPNEFAVTLSFKVSEVVKGAEKIAVGANVELLASEPMVPGEIAVLMGSKDDYRWQWWAIGPVSKQAVEHVRKLPMLPASGKERLSYFLPLLTYQDKLLKDDAFNEFALASIADLYALESVLSPDEVMNVIKAPATSKELKRLHWTLLSICGQPKDAPFVREAIAKQLRESTDEIGLDSALSCFIALGGEAALSFIDDKILKNPNARYSDVNAAVLAIRVHGTELNFVPQKRLLQSFALLLNKPDLADLVISDLARWQDWSHVDSLLKLYAEPLEKSQYLRVPVVRYLQACPTAAAVTALKKCQEIDPEAVRRAQLLFSFPPPPDEAEPSRED